MSRRRAYNGRTLEVIQRFFEVLDSLVADKTIRGIQTYCRLYGIDKRHMYAQRRDNGRGYFEVYWLMPMIEQYGVSAEWLLLGTGKARK